MAAPGIRSGSLLYKLAAPIAEHHVIMKRFQKTTIGAHHFSNSPFLSSSKYIADQDSFIVTVPPTAMATTQETLYKALVTCFDGKENNFVMDLRDPTVCAKMQYLHYWTEKRIKFVLGHELAHIANDDFGTTKKLKRKMMTALGQVAALRRLDFEEEFEADALSTGVDLETALGGIEHMLKLQGFFNFIYECSSKKGNPMSHSEFLEARSRTHPLETDRLERMYRIIAKNFNVTQEEAVALAMQDAGEDIVTNVKVKTPTASGEYTTPKAAAAKIDPKTLKQAEDLLKKLSKGKKK